MDSLCHVKKWCMHSCEKLFLCSLWCYFVIYFLRCFVTWEINIIITILSALKQFITRVHTWFSTYSECWMAKYTHQSSHSTAYNIWCTHFMFVVLMGPAMDMNPIYHGRPATIVLFPVGLRIVCYILIVGQSRVSPFCKQYFYIHLINIDTNWSCFSGFETFPINYLIACWYTLVPLEPICHCFMGGKC